MGSLGIVQQQWGRRLRSFPGETEGLVGEGSFLAAGLIATSVGFKLNKNSPFANTDLVELETEIGVQ